MSRPSLLTGWMKPRMAAARSGSSRYQERQRPPSAPRAAVSSTTPATIATRPPNWATRSGSPSITKASATANSGARLPSVPVITGPSARLAAKVSSVAAPGYKSPTTAKMATALHATVLPAKATGDMQISSKVEDGMAIAAPDKGDKCRKPSCVSTKPAPKQNAEAKARTMAALVIRAPDPRSPESIGIENFDAELFEVCDVSGDDLKTVHSG